MIICLNNDKIRYMTKNKKIAFIVSASISVLIFGIILILILTNNTSLLNFDTNIAQYFSVNNNSFFDWLFVIVSLLGGTKMILIVCAILVLLPNRKKLGIPLAVIVALSAVINLIIKLIVARTRPDGFFNTSLPLGYEFPDGYSFPSGHAQTTTVFYVALAFLLCKNYINKKPAKIAVWCASTILVALTSFARIYLCVHFASDVVAGILLAITIIMTTFVLIHILPYFEKYTINDETKHDKNNNIQK